jgi:hypothetical protein
VPPEPSEDPPEELSDEPPEVSSALWHPIRKERESTSVKIQRNLFISHLRIKNQITAHPKINKIKTKPKKSP